MYMKQYRLGRCLEADVAWYPSSMTLFFPEAGGVRKVMATICGLILTCLPGSSVGIRNRWFPRKSRKNLDDLRRKSGIPGPGVIFRDRASPESWGILGQLRLQQILLGMHLSCARYGPPSH